MNPVIWIQELPRHMTEALGSVRGHLTFLGLRRLVLFAFLGLTIVATAIGLTDLIAASEAGTVGPLEMAVVAALATAAIISMWLALEFFLQLRAWRTRYFALLIYLLLVLWSIGFGFGFYWKHLASVGVAQDQTHEMIERVDRGLSSAAGNLTTIQDQLNNLTVASDERMRQEGRSGGACDGVSTGSGEGPYWNLRGQIARDVGGLIQGMNVWIGSDAASPFSPRSSLPTAPGSAPGTSEAQPADGSSSTQALGIAELEQGTLPQRIDALRARAKAVETNFAQGTADPVGMRDELLDLSRAAARVIDQTNTIIGAKGGYVNDLGDLASKLKSDHYKLGANICRDSGLARSLQRAANTLNEIQPIPVNLADIDPQLGARATQHAFARLWRNVFWFVPGNTVDEPLGERDLQALAAAIIVDICIFFLTIYGRSDDPALTIVRVMERPVIGRELRNRLYAFIDAQGSREGVRTLFDCSLTLHREQFFLVTSSDLGSVYGSIRNLQVVLLASDVAEWLSIKDGEESEPGRTALLSALRRTLANVADRAGYAEAAANPEAFAEDRMAVLRLTPKFVFAMQGLLSSQPGSDPAAEAPQEPDPMHDRDESAGRQQGNDENETNDEAGDGRE